MNKSVTRWVKIAIVAIAGIGYISVFYFLYYSPNSPRNKEARNRAMAKEHIPVVTEVLEKDKRFGKIRLIPYTGEGGCLGVFGDVDSQSTMDDLKKLVQSTDPPVFVHWEVNIIPPDKQLK